MLKIRNISIKNKRFAEVYLRCEIRIMIGITMMIIISYITKAEYAIYFYFYFLC